MLLLTIVIVTITLCEGTIYNNKKKRNTRKLMIYATKPLSAICIYSNASPSRVFISNRFKVASGIKKE